MQAIPCKQTKPTINSNTETMIKTENELTRQGGIWLSILSAEVSRSSVGGSIFSEALLWEERLGEGGGCSNLCEIKPNVKKTQYTHEENFCIENVSEIKPNVKKSSIHTGRNFASKITFCILTRISI